MQLLKDYFNLQSLIFEYFGYVEDWKAIPLDDSTEYFWRLKEYPDGSGCVYFHEEQDALSPKNFLEGKYYSNSIYTQRHLPKWIYRGEDYTMVCVDTNIDDNKFLRVFANSKEIKKT